MAHSSHPPLRKIIHIDMDCFYAAIEIRDNPELKDKPVAVGGSSTKRGVLCTCNYIARQYDIHSAMPTAHAVRLCPDLVVLPVHMAKYQAVSKAINAIFREYTDLVEPLSLDEAFLDVTAAGHYQGSATRIAQAIQDKIFSTQAVTASAGVAPNKFLAKIASAWKKPNGLFVITPAQVDGFITQLPINKLFGVGKVTATKLNQFNIFTCADLQQHSLNELTQRFGKFGEQLYYQARGIDHRPVNPNRVRKSLSVERTFQFDIPDKDNAIKTIKILVEQLITRVQDSAADLIIKNQFIKIKYNDFKSVTAEVQSTDMNLERFIALFHKAYQERPIRLLGVGVHFQHDIEPTFEQLLLFNIDD